MKQQKIWKILLMNIQAIVEERLHWLKDDIASSESCNPRTHSLDIELEDLSESEGAAQGDPTPELLIKAYKFRDYIYDIASSESSNPRTPSPDIEL